MMINARENGIESDRPVRLGPRRQVPPQALAFLAPSVPVRRPHARGGLSTAGLDAVLTDVARRGVKPASDQPVRR